METLLQVVDASQSGLDGTRDAEHDSSELSCIFLVENWRYHAFKRHRLDTMLEKIAMGSGWYTSCLGKYHSNHVSQLVFKVVLDKSLSVVIEYVNSPLVLLRAQVALDHHVLTDLVDGVEEVKIRQFSVGAFEFNVNVLDLAVRELEI